MLRLLVLLLALANAGYYAWSQGAMRDWGLGPGSSAEPQRLQQQIKPDAVRILPASEARRAAAATSVAAAAAKSECLLAGPIVETKLARVKDALASWPPGSWKLAPVVQPASWMVYMGKYAGVEQLARKKAELRERGVAFDDIQEASLQPGLSLGRFTAEAEATKRLQALAQSGVHTARVVQEHPEPSQQLTLPAVDDALRPRVEALRPVLEGIKLRPCPPAGDTS